MGLVGSALKPGSGAGQLHVVLDQDTIVKDGERAGGEALAGGAGSSRRRRRRRRPPALRRGGREGSRGRGVLAVDRTGTAIGVRLVPVRIEHLDFITVESEKEAAIASPLPFSFRGHGCGPFEMQLAIAEILQGAHVPASFHTFHVTVFGYPLGRAAICSPRRTGWNHQREPWRPRAVGRLAGGCLPFPGQPRAVGDGPGHAPATAGQAGPGPTNGRHQE